MATHIEIKVAQDTGLILEPTLRETKAPPPPGKDHGDDVKEKEYIPLIVAREKIQTLQTELRNMKQRHIGVFEGLQKAFDVREAAQRAEYDKVLLHAKHEAKMRITTHRERGEKFKTELIRERRERERQEQESNERLAELRSRIEGLDSHMAELNQSLDKTRELHKTARAENDVLTRERDELAREKKQLHRDLEDAAEDHKRAAGRSEETARELSAEMVRLNENIADWTRRHGESEARGDAAEAKCRELEAQIEQLERDKRDAADTAASLEARIAKLEDDARVAEDEARARAREIVDLGARLEDMTRDLALRSEGGEAAAQEASVLRGEVAEAQRELRDIVRLLGEQDIDHATKPDVGAARALAERLQDMLKTANEDLERARASHADLQQQLASRPVEVVYAGGSGGGGSGSSGGGGGGSDPKLEARRATLAGDVKRLEAEVAQLRAKLVALTKTHDEKKAVTDKSHQHLLELQATAKASDDERKVLIDRYRLMSEVDGKLVFTDQRQAALARLVSLLEADTGGGGGAGATEEDKKRADAEARVAVIKASFATNNAERKRLKAEGQDAEAAVLYKQLEEDKKEHDALKAWLKANPSEESKLAALDEEKKAKDAKRVEIKDSFTALKAEMKALRDELTAAQNQGEPKDEAKEAQAAAMYAQLQERQTEYKTLGAWLTAYPAAREEIVKKLAERGAAGGGGNGAEQQAVMADGLGFQWMSSTGVPPYPLESQVVTDLKRLQAIQQQRQDFKDAKAASAPIKAELVTIAAEQKSAAEAQHAAEERLRKLKAELQSLPPASSSASSAASHGGSSSGGGGGGGGASAAELAESRATIEKLKAQYASMVKEKEEQVKRLEALLRAAREGDADSRFKGLEEQLREEQELHEKKVAQLQAASRQDEEQLSKMRREYEAKNAEITRLSESLRRAEASLRDRPAGDGTVVHVTHTTTASSEGGGGGGSSAELEQRLDEQTRAVADLRAQLDAAQSAKSKLEDQVGELQGRIDAVSAKDAPLLTNAAIKELQEHQHALRDSLDSETKKAKGLEEKLHAREAALTATQSEVAQLKAQAAASATQHASEVAELRAAADKLAAESKQAIHELETRLTESHAKQTADLNAAHAAKVAELEAAKAALQASLTASEDRANGLDRDLKHETGVREERDKSLADLRAEHKELSEKHALCDAEIARLTKETTERKATMEQQAAQIAELLSDQARLKVQVQEEQDRRKEFQLQIEDLKGKIRVYARVRPFSAAELADPVNNPDAVRLGANNWTVELHSTEYAADGKTVRKEVWEPFVFDAVFHQKIGNSQAQVFEECKAFVDLAIGGINTCIFCYGQSGTGKTFTMSGKPVPDLRGLKPRSILHIFDHIERNKATTEFKVSAYAVEVYNDTLRDLMWRHMQFKRTNSSNPNKWGPEPELKLKPEYGPKDKSGAASVKRMKIEGCMTQEFKDPAEMMEVLDAVEIRRITRATGLNPESSRSHLVLAITIEARHTSGKHAGKSTTGKISLVDLAGSEKPGKAELEGLAPKLQEELALEGKHINMSLTNLRTVFQGLSSTDKKTVVQYTGTLNTLMRDSLGGNSKALMFVNLGPSAYNVKESKDSLGFGKIVSNVITQAKAGAETDNSELIKNMEFKLEQYERKFGKL